MVYTGPCTSINTAPKNGVKELPAQAKKVNPHDPDQAEQTADIARNEILSHYPQVEPQPDIHPVKDRGDSRIHYFRNAVCIHIHVWHSHGCSAPRYRVVIPLHKFSFFSQRFNRLLPIRKYTERPVNQSKENGNCRTPRMPFERYYSYPF